MSYLSMPLQGMLIADLARGFSQTGMTDYQCNFIGQITGMLKEIKPAKQVLEEMVEQASEILESGLSVEVATR